jgi:malate dehydrogenase (oxaloacetate-decarboxylating)
VNALKITGRSREQIRVVVSGAGAAGIAIARLLRDWGVRDLILTDSKGICSADRSDLNPFKKEFAVEKGGTLIDALENADVFIGVSQPDLLSAEDIKLMKADPVVFAMANPVPEISPQQCAAAGVAVYASGRSDYPNQINNVLVFPGFFRGLFDAGAHRITGEMKLRAAMALASMVDHPTPDRIIPAPFESGVADAVAHAVKSAAAAFV